ncbi:signal peptidase II [Suicoccus acidiformans]|uniref:Lipoprotein signal peptidase n=1 Tax=Suicoccus acidiformans TaxID=2036206 RepID=A0A347WL63_9LACT|nr:signal peptidase II [Suicoccus acidiformans]AXY25820.1 signal peptidase II [Suicoccus acidiformans]
MLIVIVFASLTVLCDQLVKVWAVRSIPLHSSSPGIPALFDFYYVQNTGASWGLFEEGRVWLSLVTVIFLACLFYYIWRRDRIHPLSALAYGLIIGGALGNLIDRLRLGYVVDMFRLTFIDFPIFNVADMAITVGVILFIVIIIFDIDEEVI